VVSKNHCELSSINEGGTLSYKAAAALTSLPLSTIQSLVRDKSLPSLRVGRRRLIPRRALLAFLDAHLEGAGRRDA
jgi:excisionase family DNA binding protein